MIGFTNGCFDILHIGHIRYLKEARSKCQKLIVGLNSDKSVKCLKGKGRPINSQDIRAELLESLRWVDQVLIFDEKTPLRLIKQVQPDVIFKGGDYNADKVVGYNWIKKRGGCVKIIKFHEGFSTTKIINELKNRS